MKTACIAIVFLCLLHTASTQQRSKKEAPDESDQSEKRIEPPAFNLGQDISKKTLEELRYLRSELYARKGYLFPDAVIRAYFQGKKWYQPEWEDPKRTITLSDKEEAFIARVKEREAELLKQNYVSKNDVRRANVRNVVNTAQFTKIPKQLLDKLDKNNFAIVPDKQAQLFDVYEQNDYSLLPNFITTDLYLQLVHMFFNFLLRSVEQDHFFGSLKSILTSVTGEAQSLASTNVPAEIKDAAEYVQAYAAIPLNILEPKTKLTVKSKYAEFVKEETKRIQNAAGQGSRFLDAPLFDYTLFKPRGHYARTIKLSHYFKAMMWLQSAPFEVESDAGCARMVVLASLLNRARGEQGKPLMEIHGRISSLLSFVVGEPDNLGIQDVCTWMGSKSPEEIIPGLRYAALREKLKALNPEHIRPKGGIDVAVAELSRLRVYFFPQRYTPDAEILQRMVHVLRDPSSKRPFPKGLDVFAALGNKTAESILLNEYNENSTWPHYGDTLEVLKKQFSSFRDSAGSVYKKWMQGLGKTATVHQGCPPFMETDAWQRKNLNTALASWAELKHDMVLYAKQPMSIECGGDEMPPRPTTVGYVEPNRDFWTNSVELLALTEQVMNKHDLWTKDVKAKTKALREMAEFFLGVSGKELRGEKLSIQEYETIRLIGASASNLTLSIIDQQDWYSVTGPERYAALVTDVYTYNDQCLEEAVGLVNCIYAIVEIEGLLYLTRGAVFSYYEFIQPTSDRLTDKEWQKMLQKKKAPQVPVWMKDLIVPVTPLEVVEGSSYSSGC